MKEEFIIHTIDMPQSLKKKLERALMVEEYTSKAKISRYQEEVNRRYAKSLNTYAWAEFHFEQLGTEDEEMLSYSHRVDADLKNNQLHFVREGTAEPNIYEKLTLSINPKQ